MKSLILVSIASLVILLGGIFVFGSKNSGETAKVSYSANANERPRVEVKETFYDFGEISVKDTKEFVVKNTGNRSLELSNVSSNCGCTSGQIVYKNKESREFSMHSRNSEITEVLPGDSAIVRLIYRPFTMPVYGKVEREVYVSTNDPQDPKLVFQTQSYVK